MKIFCLFLLIAVAMEKCNGNGCHGCHNDRKMTDNDRKMKYLLVEIDDGRGKFLLIQFGVVEPIAIIKKVLICIWIGKWTIHFMIHEKSMLSLRIQKLAAWNIGFLHIVWAFAWPKMKLGLEVFENENCMLAPNTSPLSRNAFKMDFHVCHKHAADGMIGAANRLLYFRTL